MTDDPELGDDPLVRKIQAAARDAIDQGRFRRGRAKPKSSRIRQLEPAIRAMRTAGASWTEIVALCSSQGLDVSAVTIRAALGIYRAGNKTKNASLNANSGANINASSDANQDDTHDAIVSARSGKSRPSQKAAKTTPRKAPDADSLRKTAQQATQPETQITAQIFGDAPAEPKKFGLDRIDV